MRHRSKLQVINADAAKLNRTSAAIQERRRSLAGATNKGREQVTAEILSFGDGNAGKLTVRSDITGLGADLTRAALFLPSTQAFISKKLRAAQSVGSAI